MFGKCDKSPFNRIVCSVNLCSHVNVLNQCLLQAKDGKNILPLLFPKRPNRVKEEKNGTEHAFVPSVLLAISLWDLLVYCHWVGSLITMRVQLLTVTFTENVQLAFMNSTFPKIHRAFSHLSSVEIVSQSRCCDFVVWASRYDTITSIWLSGAIDNVERTLCRSHITEKQMAVFLPVPLA